MVKCVFFCLSFLDGRREGDFCYFHSPRQHRNPPNIQNRLPYGFVAVGLRKSACAGASRVLIEF